MFFLVLVFAVSSNVLPYTLRSANPFGQRVLAISVIMKRQLRSTVFICGKFTLKGVENIRPGHFEVDCIALGQAR